MKNQKSNHHMRGQGMVEFALILGILLLIIAGSIDMGRGIYAFSVVQNAAREGARFGVINPDDVGGIQDAARRLTAGLDGAAVSVIPSYLDARTLQVTVSYAFEPITPFLARFMGESGNITLESSASMRIEE
jgi:hypothetical protein